jgi:hypothetical protein
MSDAIVSISFLSPSINKSLAAAPTATHTSQPNPTERIPDATALAEAVTATSVTRLPLSPLQENNCRSLACLEHHPVSQCSPVVRPLPVDSVPNRAGNTCVLCGELGSPTTCGPLVPVSLAGEEVSVHHACALWAPQVYQDEVQPRGDGCHKHCSHFSLHFSITT